MLGYKVPCVATQIFLNLESHCGGGGGGGMEVCLHVSVFMLSFVGTGLAMGRLPRPRSPVSCVGKRKVVPVHTMKA